jgi:hypothetical protein
MPDLDIPFFWRLREGTSTRKINEPGSKPQLGVGLGTLFQSSQSSPMIGYHRLIPESQLFTGKDLTVPIEQDNSNIRHFLARFRRRTKVVSKAVEMVDLSLRIYYQNATSRRV